jgi:hypothetical protein
LSWRFFVPFSRATGSWIAYDTPLTIEPSGPEGIAPRERAKSAANQSSERGSARGNSTRLYRDAEEKKMSAGRPRNAARDFAQVNGDKFYEGSACWCGNTKRYTKGGRCVDCAIAQARTQSMAKRKPKMATPAQQRTVRKDPALAAQYTRASADANVEIATDPNNPIAQQIAELAARENEITAEEAARAEKVAAINRIETGGLTLCGVAVTPSEMAEYVRTGIVPARILAEHKEEDEDRAHVV